MAAILGGMLGEGEERRENMKAITIILVLFGFGCATAPSRPNTMEMMQAIQEHRITVDQINQAYADYEKARQEYENSASYKLTLAAIFPLLILGGAANGLSCGYRGSGYRGYQGYQGCGGRAVINTVPTTGGGSVSTIKYYR
jgi:hypothetical protein